MSRRGSEKFPIDLTEDRSSFMSTAVEKIEESVDRPDLNLISINQKLEYLEKKIMEGKGKGHSEGHSKKSHYVSRKGFTALWDQCERLESRLETLEGFVGTISQIFCNGNKVEKSVDQSPSRSVQSSLKGRSEGQETINIVEGIDKSFDGLDAFTRSKQEEATRQSLHAHSSEIITQNQEIASAASENIDEIAEGGEEGSNVLNQNEAMDIDDRDIKPLIKLPKLPSIKQEVEFPRDDQGRILINIYCAVRRVGAGIAAVAGTYFTDSMSNEFPFPLFPLERGTREVRIHAEIKAALFGIELVKEFFPSSFGKECVMITSSCLWSPFVQYMKSNSKAYPNWNSCHCEVRDCEHSASRWRTTDRIGNTQKDILPDLIVSKSALRAVHWCTPENISDQEKQVLQSYKSVVETHLSEYILKLGSK